MEIDSKISNDSEDDDAPILRVKRRIHQFSDSESDSNTGYPSKDNVFHPLTCDLPSETTFSNKLKEINHDDSDENVNINRKNKSTINDQKHGTSSDSDSSLVNNIKEQEDSGRDFHEQYIKNSEHDIVKSNEDSRIKTKRKRLKNKFKGLINKRNKENDSGSDSHEDNEKHNNELSSGEESTSIELIRQKIKESAFQMRSSVCDSDTSSDEEGQVPSRISVPKQQRKSTKSTSPKPLRMSAKQAMENMQKIKSESNRMLREKEVSLPYHRPKALSLQAILSKRRPAVTKDGKALPIKMNEDQLRQYAQQLEERQKEVIELCKSESEDEVDETAEENEQKSLALNDSHDTNIAGKVVPSDKDVSDNLDIATLSDSLFDDIKKTESSQNEKTLNSALDENIDINQEQIHIKVSKELMEIEETPSCNESKLTDMHKLEEEGLGSNTTSTSNINNTEKNNSAVTELLYNDSLEESTTNINLEKKIKEAELTEIKDDGTPNTEVDSQLISLHYDTEKNENSDKAENIEVDVSTSPVKDVEVTINSKEKSRDDFSDDEMNMDVIDALIENAEVTLSQNVNSPMLIREPDLTRKPKILGAPGMVIDLDGTDPFASKKTGVELLKERFVFFSKLKTPEELEREKEKSLKPGMQHIQLRQKLEDEIAEQRSLEWTKRLEEEKQNKLKLDDKKGESLDAEDIDEIEAKLNEKEDENDKEESSGESEPEEEPEIFDKPRKRNPLVDDEAEVSDCDEVEDEINNDRENDDDGNEADEEEMDEDENDDSEESTEESEDEEQNKLRKGRILKAFEDSDDEDTPEIIVQDEKCLNEIKKSTQESTIDNQNLITTQASKDTQDDVLQLAQKSKSDDLFTSQDSKSTKCSKDISSQNTGEHLDDNDLGTQTFSILESSAKGLLNIHDIVPEKLSIPTDSQTFDDNLDGVIGMCSGSFSQTQNLVPPSQMTDVPPSQVFGDDVLALCTGKFYDNKFVSQDNGNYEDIETENEKTLSVKDIHHKELSLDAHVDDVNSETLRPISENSTDVGANVNGTKEPMQEPKQKANEDPNLKSILDELNDPEFDSPKPNKYFVGNTQDKENSSSVANANYRKKFVIDSDEDEVEPPSRKKKKIKKKKLKERALQISDDEEEEFAEDVEEEEEYESETALDDEERIVEYDSEENEIIVEPQNRKNKRKMAEYFENEAELSSEDEWVGSGDEDEAGLDRMEREAGDDDTFNQARLQRQLGQIHMRDVLDQDKREVRLIQELLFEDGDLGTGSRQRKFRWKNADGEEEVGGVDEEIKDTQEEEFESEELWRKQRHEREMFLRSLKKDEDPEDLNISISRTSIIKANLSKNASSLFAEDTTIAGNTESPLVEKKTSKDIPSPKKPFAIFKQNYHTSLLARGGGALARLAALATPLANDDDGPKPGSLAPTGRRNFVFAAIDDPKEDEPKVNKRKADSNIGTPRLVKKLRTEDKQKHHKTSLLDHLKV